MNHEDFLSRLLERLPESAFADIERLSISLLPGAEDAEEPAPGPRMGYEEAKAYALAAFEKTLHRLAQ